MKAKSLKVDSFINTYEYLVEVKSCLSYNARKMRHVVKYKHGSIPFLALSLHVQLHTSRGKESKSAQSGRVRASFFHSWLHPMRIFLHLATEREELTPVTYIFLYIF
jgi:hypothetical protein